MVALQQTIDKLQSEKNVALEVKSKELEDNQIEMDLLEARCHKLAVAMEQSKAKIVEVEEALTDLTSDKSSLVSQLEMNEQDCKILRQAKENLVQ